MKLTCKLLSRNFWTFFLFLFFAAFGEVRAQSDYDYWKDTNLTFSYYLHDVLSDCGSTKEKFLGCFESLNKILALNESPLLAADTEKLSNPLIEEKVKTYEYGISLYLTKRAAYSGTNEQEKFKELKASEKAHFSAIGALYPKIRNDGTRLFQKIFLDIKETLLVGLTKEKEAWYSANAINAYLRVAEDPHTYLLSYRQYLEWAKDTDEEVEFGFEFQIVADYPEVLVVSSGSEAMLAGLHYKDKIIEINGQSLKGLPHFEVDKKFDVIKNHEPVQIKVLREKDILNLTITRCEVNRPNVEPHFVADRGTLYGYIKLRSFMPEDSTEKFQEALKVLTVHPIQGLILDLRGNGGGRLEQAISIAELFLGKGKLVVVRKNLADGTQEPFYTEKDAITDLPMVTLIDAQSASSSEILAGALQDHQRSKIVGVRSFGKATVQKADWYYSFEDAIIKAKTYARFYLPSGKTNQITGIVPDFSVEPFLGATSEDQFATREGDLYSNALPPEGEAWSQPRPNEVNKINQCRADHGKADELYEQNVSISPNRPDYRLYTAQDILWCITENQK